jgi:hypothetical protein
MRSDTFENVSLKKRANIYYDGEVSSRTILFPDGSRKTLGIMLPGEYEFKTQSEEQIDLLQGSASFKLPGSERWKVLKGGNSLTIPPKSRFKVKVKELLDYCCSYK